MKVHKEIRYATDQGFYLTFQPANEDDIILKKTKSGYEIKYLVQDDSNFSPDEEGDNNLFLVNYHRDFFVGRKDIISKEESIDWYQGKKIEQSRDYYIFQLSCLVHSGVWLSLSDSFTCDSGGWDTSHVGVVLASKKEFKSRSKAVVAAEGLIKTWNQYLEGDVYMAVKEFYNEKKEQIHHNTTGGYYGYKESMKELKVM